MSGTYSPQAGRDQDTVVVVERHEIGDCAQRDEVQLRVHGSAGGVGIEYAAVAQQSTERCKHVESNTDTGQSLAGKGLAGKVGINHDFCIRQRFARQMMIGNDHLHAEFARPGDAFEAGYTVVDGHQQLRAGRSGLFGKPRRQAVTQPKAVRHHEVDLATAEQAKPADHQCGSGGAVCIEVADDNDRFIPTPGFNKPFGSDQGRRQPAHRQQCRQRRFELRRRHIARCEDPSESRMQAVGQRL